MSALLASLAVFSVALTLSLPLSECADVSTSITARSELFVSLTSDDEVLFSCELSGATGYSPVWELSGRQIRSSSSLFTINTTSDSRQSNLTVSRDGRDSIGMEVISVQCHADDQTRFRLIMGTQTLYIVQFEPPGPVGDLEVVYHSQSHFRLQWSRPEGLNPLVPLSYSVVISGSIDRSYETMETYVLVDQSTATVCQLHNISVTPSTSAGPSPTATVTHTIPISLNITPIVQSQKVTGLTLSNNGPIISIFFLGATSCGEQFPVLNHTVQLEGQQGELVMSGELPDRVSLSLVPVDFPDLDMNQLVRIIITACTELTCNSPSLPLVTMTTDTQETMAIFYSTSVSLTCSFATGSQARGCLFVFQLTNQPTTSENVSVSLTQTPTAPTSNSSCDLLSNTRGAYDELVLVYDIESDGSTGSLPLTATVVVYEDPDNFTCPIPTAESTRHVLSHGAIAGIVVASVFAAIFLGLAIFLTIALVLSVRKEKKENPEVPWPKTTVNVLIRWNPLKWTSRFSHDAPTIGGKEDTFLAGQDDATVPKSPVAVMVLSCEGDKSVAVEPLECDKATGLLSDLIRRRKTPGAKAYVRLYPEELPPL